MCPSGVWSGKPRPYLLAHSINLRERELGLWEHTITKIKRFADEDEPLPETREWWLDEVWHFTPRGDRW